MNYRKIHVDTKKLPLLPNNKIDWNASIGSRLIYKIEGTQYNGVIDIIGVEGYKLIISIDGGPHIQIVKGSLRKGMIAKQLGVKA